MASLRGFALEHRRYDATTERRVAAALERESWDAERWRRCQTERLATVLERAARRVPWYREHWEGQQRAGRGDGWRDLANWPIVTKETLRENASAFLADDADRRRLVEEHTSGSTATPLVVWWSREATLTWYALVEARLRRWHGVTRRDRWAILGGQLVAPARQTRPPFWVWNGGMRQLYLSSYHLEPGNAATYLEAMERHRVRYLLAYPSAMAALAGFANEQRIAGPRLQVALANAEPLFPYQRRAVEQAFGAPVRDSYGTAELAAGASECEAGRLHLWPEVARLEVLDGSLVSTGLLNDAMPLVRYEVGDRVVLSEGACSCGRRLPILGAVEGRLDDVIVTPEGRRVGRLDPVFKADLPIREAQIVQESVERVVLRVVPAAGYNAAVAADIERRLRDRLGPSIVIDVEEVGRLERGQAGKLRAVISRIGRPLGGSEGGKH